MDAPTVSTACAPATTTTTAVPALPPSPPTGEYLEFEDPDGYYGHLEATVYPIATDRGVYAIGSITAGKTSLVLKATFVIRKSYGGQLKLDLKLGNVDVAAAWGPPLPTRPQGLFVKAAASLDSIREGIIVSGALKEVLDFGSGKTGVSGDDFGLDVAFDLAVVDEGVAARFNVNMKVLGFSAMVSTALCATSNQAADPCRGLYDEYASSVPAGVAVGSIAFFLQFDVSGSIGIGASGGGNYLIELPSFSGTAVVEHSGDFYIRARGVINWPIVVVAEFVFTDEMAEFSMVGVPFFLFKADFSISATWGGLNGGSPSMTVAASFYTTGTDISALVDGVKNAVTDELEALAAEIESYQFEDCEGSCDLGCACNSCPRATCTGDCTGCCNPNPWSSCPTCVEQGIRYAAYLAEIVVYEACVGICEAACFTAAKLCEGACELANLALRAAAAVVQLVSDAVALVLDAIGGIGNIFKINKMSLSTTISFGNLWDSSFTISLDAVLAGIDIDESLTINLGDVFETVKNLAERAWDALTGGDGRRSRRRVKGAGWFAPLDNLSPEAFPLAVEKLMETFSAGPLGGVLPAWVFDELVADPVLGERMNSVNVTRLPARAPGM